MFDDLRTYGIISILLILVMGYFVYVNYRDNMILKNDVKEIKEFFYNGNEEDKPEEDEEDEEDEEYDEYEDQHVHNSQLVFDDVDEFFAHVKPTQLPVIEELLESEPVISEEKVKKRKQRKPKKTVEEEVIEVQPDYNETEVIQE